MAFRSIQKEEVRAYNAFAGVTCPSNLPDSEAFGFDPVFHYYSDLFEPKLDTQELVPLLPLYLNPSRP